MHLENVDQSQSGLREGLSALMLGSLIIAVSTFIATLCMGFEGIASLLGAVLVGVASGAVLSALALRLSKWGWGTLFLLAPLVLTTALALVVPGMLQHSIIGGGDAIDVSLAEVSNHPNATAFNFRDGTLMPLLRGSQAIFGGSRGTGSHRVGTVFVVPVVPEGWAPDQPISVWAVADDTNYDELAKAWRATSHGGGLRVNAVHAAEYEQAVRSLRGKARPAPDPIFVHWTTDPNGMQRDVRARFLNMVGVGSALWAVLVLLAAARRNRPQKLSSARPRK